ncbi:MAG: ABC transporter permease [Candidatus Bathyarchaeia archaeon]
MGLLQFTVRRLILLIPTLIGVTLLIFAVTQLISPAQRALLYVTSDKQLEKIDLIITKYGLDRPFYEQYFNWIVQVLQGNLGIAKSAGNQPVLKVLLDRFPATLELTLYSAPLIIFFGIYLGVKSAVHRDKAIDHVTRAAAIIGWSLPSFWLGIVLLAIFYGGLGWFPPKRLSTAAETFVNSAAWHKYTGLYTIDGLLNGQIWITIDAFRHLVLPVIVLTTINVALLIRVMRSSMLESLSKGYIVTARAKGLKNSVVINKHARRNALIPVVTLSGLLIAGMLGGLIITETVFAFPGIGQFAANAALTGPDLPAVLGFALFTGTIFVLANLIVDILYAYIDPRIKLG